MGGWDVCGLWVGCRTQWSRSCLSQYCISLNLLAENDNEEEDSLNHKPWGVGAAFSEVLKKMKKKDENIDVDIYDPDNFSLSMLENR